MDGGTFGADLDALEAAGEEAAAPLAGGDGLGGAAGAGGDGDDEAGEVLGFGTEPVGHPRAHRGAAGDLGTGVHEHVGGIVIDGLGGHRANEAEVIDDGADVGEEGGDFGSVPAELGEGKHGALTVQFLALELGELLTAGEAFRHGRSIQCGELGFRIEGFELGRASGHGEPDDAFGACRQGRRSEYALGWRVREQRGAEEAGQGHGAEALDAAAEELASTPLGRSGPLGVRLERAHTDETTAAIRSGGPGSGTWAPCGSRRGESRGNRVETGQDP